MDKDYILKEIDRTAKENNGIPLGKGRFAKETGIKWTDWEGKYWTKWSDAIIEAGYVSNKMQSAYDENALIEQVVSFIKEIGRFPTSADFRLKAYETGNFPSHSTIRNRLGIKSEVVTKIMSYCQRTPEYSDVTEICKKIPSTLVREIEHHSKETDVEFGYVYLMKSGRFYKIGSSRNVERRNYDLGIKLPENINILHKIKTDDPNGIENYWHNRFRDKRKQGEWFDLSSIDISAFKRRKFM
jgi:hypothetical protein